MLKLASLFIAVSAFAVSATAQVQSSCSMTPYGSSCGLTATGGTEAAGGSHFRFSVTVSGAIPGQPVVWMVSTAPGEIPLTVLGSRCSLLIDSIAFSQQHRIGHDGTYTFSKSLPGSVPQIYAYFQFIALNMSTTGFELTASNGLYLRCD